MYEKTSSFCFCRYSHKSTNYYHHCRSSDNIFISVYGYSNTGIASVGAYQTINNGNGDGFLAEFNSHKTLQWATYYGGSNGDEITGLTEDGLGNLYFGGYTGSTADIAMPGSHQDIYAGNADAFLAKFDMAGNSHWASYSGGFNTDEGTGLCSEGLGNVYLSGSVSTISKQVSIEIIDAKGAMLYTDKSFVNNR